MTPLEFKNAIDDWEGLRIEQFTGLGNVQKSLMSMIRWQTMFIYNGNTDKRRHIKDPKKLLPFSFDPKESENMISDPAKMKALLLGLS